MIYCKLLLYRNFYLYLRARTFCASYVTPPRPYSLLYEARATLARTILSTLVTGTILRPNLTGS
jgi:hypothetical protein